MTHTAIIQGLLYIAGNDGIEVNAIKKVLNISVDEIRDIVKELKKQYDHDQNCGLTINIYGSSYYLLTKSEIKEYASKLIDVRIKNPLTPAIMETLAIIAYNHPCTGSKIEEIRGINSDSAIKRLIDLKLIENIGRSTTAGRPYLYELTKNFFNLFGIKNISDLPKIDINKGKDLDQSFFDTNRYDEDEE
jgi:segregation and condensation protein B